MKLFNLNEAPIGERDVVFGASVWRAANAALVCAGAVGVAVYALIFGHIGQIDASRWVAGFVAAFFFLIFWVAKNSWIAAQHETNWVVRIKDDRVLIKFRSFENWRMNQEDVQVVELMRGEIAFVRKVRQTQVSRGMDQVNSVQVNRRVEVEIVLKDGDTGALEKALAEERGKRGWGKHSETKVLDYPVQVVDAGSVRVMWSNNSARIRPGVKRALEAFSAIARVEEEEKKGTEDFTPSGLRKLGEAEQERKLKELATGNKMAAIVAVKGLYNCSLSEAKERVEAIMKEG